MTKPITPYIERLLRQLNGRVSVDDTELLSTFARLLWARTLEEDLASRNPADDAGATVESWRRFANRDAETINIFLSNPVAARDGWQSNHSIVVVTAPDMPFMVDSVLMALSHDGIVTHHLNNVVLGVDRAGDGKVTDVSEDLEHHNRDLLIYAEVDRLEDDELPQLHAKLEKTTAELQAVVDDFPAMKSKVEEIIASLETKPPALPADEIDEAVAFLRWLLANHLTFLGCRTFAYANGNIRQSGDALGVHRVRPPASERRMADQPDRTQQFLQTPTLLSFSKSGTRSRVHRPAYPDYIGIKQFDEHSKVIGEIGLSGLYTSRVYMEFPENIPVVRRKVGNVIERSKLDPSGFDGKVFAQVLATYPRDELFQIGEDDLLENAMVITDIHERRRVRVFHRVDPYGLFITTLVYMPRDLFSTAIRLKLRDLLMQVFDAEDADHDILLSESILVRVQFNLRIRPGQNIELDRIGLEKQIAEMIGDWDSELNETLQSSFGESQGRKLKHAYAGAFSAGYRENFSARATVYDIETMQALSAGSPLSTRLYRKTTDEPTLLRLKLFHLGSALPLSDVVPKLENLGLQVISEHPYVVKRNGIPPVAVHDYRLQFDCPLDLADVSANFDDAFVNIWQQQAEDDPFNRLVLNASLSWRQVSVLRAYAQYMKQIRFGFSQMFISTTLNNHARLAEDLVRYFELRFDPAETETAADQTGLVRARLIDGFEVVQLLNEDRILRRVLELIEATLRTNYFVTDGTGQARSFLSLKLSPGAVSDMPLPRPKFEIFVSAPHFEGVHLRGGPVARGGLRWSDRLEDFRTEVLGLVKAQVVKNAVIVPTGAKGGFVVKGSISGELCYQDFIRGLLDITDNVLQGATVTPQAVVARDDPDPYLVVAADKGTATFSDTANAIAAEYNFWLGDGFASGGSFGYDHKKMGITARGAWISVQRHFAETNIDIQRETVTVLGIGDMAGDVFGNGMLLSKSIKLVAAFNHQHIFLDPDPDPASSYAERERLFALPRSSWTDYDTSLISSGGGVFSRNLKSVQISAEARARFDINAPQLPPDELIHQLLRSPVQLIWNGGVGTFVKASSESHDDAGDRSNDHLRIDASELRCTVFGEGGNLGLTQLARVEFSLAGGRVNTDFIDNSAGVDCSDHEVNIKIALNGAVAKEDLTRKQRNKLLEGMTDEVAELVLANSYNQAQSLSLAVHHAASHHTEYQRLIGLLSQHAGLDRTLEFLPSDEELAERYSAERSFTRPELAILLAYTKIYIKNQLIAGGACGEPMLSRRVFAPFPTAMTDSDTGDLSLHPLAQEITATQLANEMVDRMGISYAAHLTELTSASLEEIALAYAVVAECFDFDDWYEDIRLTSSIDAQAKLALLSEVARLGRRASSWVVKRLQSGESPQQLSARLALPLQALIEARDGSIGDRGSAWKASVDTLVAGGLDNTLARKTAYAADLASLLPILDTAQHRGCDAQALTHLNVVVGHELQIDWLASQIAGLPSSTHWQATQRESLLETLHRLQIMLSANVLASSKGDLNAWLSQHPRFEDTWSEIVNEVRCTNQPDASVFAVVTNKLGELVTA